MAESATALRQELREQLVTQSRVLVIVPAFNEARSVGGVVAELRAFDPDLAVVVVDDGSTDDTAAVAAAAGATVLRLPYNLGIGGAVQTGQQYGRDEGFDIAVQVDGDGQHDPRELPKLLVPVLAGDADMAVGTRFGGEDGYRSSLLRRIGIAVLARVVSMLVRQRVTDPTSGFRAVNRRALELFAGDYPHDYPEAEATVIAHRHRLRVLEVPVRMRPRAGGTSSIGGIYSLVYMGKVLVALFVGLFRSYPKEVG
ncbi:MAG TPA: glycosyltransferase family 2 protein [Gaiellaceae bacterium]|nr:glycosyltransferase family 2 protein [Gaiellaceae bacterium]